MRLISVLWFSFILVCSSFIQISAKSNQDVTLNQKKASFDPVETIMHHIKDAHSWHLWGEKEKAVSIPLPVILWDNGRLHLFSSSAFGLQEEKTVLSHGQYYRMYHEKIYKTDALGEFIFDANNHPTNQKPFDFSITKNVASMFLASMFLVIIFIGVSKGYDKNLVPSGLAGFMEPVILFIQDEVVRPSIGAKYARYMPYLLTLFFFIWFNNLLGLIPGGANVTGNISITFFLAIVSMVVVNFSGNKDYWKHVFWMPGVPIPVKIIMAPIELIGIVSKPFALMIRLFANITGGHIVMLSLISLIFIFKTVYIAPASILLGLFVSVLEFLVAFLQAYVFTMLTALFIGLAVEDHHEEAH